MSERVYIFDTTLRDGEQSPGCSMTVPEKMRMARKLADLGVDILEAGFPIASEGDFEAVDAISREFPWMQVAALGRACTTDVERAAQSLKHARRPRIHTFIATSDIHLKYKLKKSREQVLEEAVAAVELARGYVDDVEFSAEDGGCRSAHRQHSRHGRIFHSRRIRRADRPHREGAGRLRHCQRTLP
jgi:2-isopropylmalate synthase